MKERKRQEEGRTGVGVTIGITKRDVGNALKMMRSGKVKGIKSNPGLSLKASVRG